MNFVGIDVGASTTKSIIINDKKEILGYAISNSGADFQAAAEQVFDKSQERAKDRVSD